MEESFVDKKSEESKAEILTEKAIDSLRKTAPMMKFISIAGIVFCVYYIYQLVKGGQDQNAHSNDIGSLGIAFLIVIFILIIVPSIYLYTCANNIIDFCNERESQTLEKAFDYQKRYWSFMTFMSVIYMLFFLLELIS